MTPLEFVTEGADCFARAEVAMGGLCVQGLVSESMDPTSVSAYAWLIDATNRLDAVAAYDLLRWVIRPALEEKR